MAPRVCVVTSGSLASCPRMLKAADALHEAGYRVRVVCAEQVDWAIKASRHLRATRPWDCRVVHYHRVTGRRTFLASGLRHRLARAAVRALGVAGAPRRVLAAAFTRVAPELYREAVA